MFSQLLLFSVLILSTYEYTLGHKRNMETHLHDHLMLLTRIFSRIDNNNDKFLDKDELLTVASRMDSLQLEDNVEHEFDSLDHDADDLISIEECMHNHFDKKVTPEVIQRIELEKRKYSKSESEFWMQRSIRKFRQADQNKDGYLSKSELKFFLHPEAYIEMKEVLVDATLEDHDLNGNGVIELAELKARGNTALFDESVRPSNSADDTDAFSGPLDKNRDGTLDREEIWKWISMEESRYHLDEVEHMLGEVDDNKDGKISFEEVKKHDYKIMDSPITGHGRLYRDEL